MSGFNVGMAVLNVAVLAYLVFLIVAEMKRLTAAKQLWQDALEASKRTESALQEAMARLNKAQELINDAKRVKREASNA